MAEEMLSYRSSHMHDAAMTARFNPVLILAAVAARLARTRRGVNFVNFGHLDTVR